MTTSLPTTTSVPQRVERFPDSLVRSVLVLATIAITADQWHTSPIVWRPLATALVVLSSACAVASIFPWTSLPSWQRVAIVALFAASGALVLPLAHSTWVTALFAYLATGVAGAKLASRRAAIGIAVGASLIAAAMSWEVLQAAPHSDAWPWWLGLTVGLPVYGGIVNRYRLDAVFAAQQAVDEAHRAAEVDARAARTEQERTAQKVHDVVDQLELAETLMEQGADLEALIAVRRAHAVAAESITGPRPAEQASGADPLPGAPP
ncbi:hypothetical protein GCM10023147_41650 [Tsukamurella soli]|uniref:Histidine kinase n=2 Tax=Tsukamurella soli TaxID=644556 RepID=A0ABP8K8J2_9ACTN